MVFKDDLITITIIITIIAIISTHLLFRILSLPTVPTVSCGGEEEGPGAGFEPDPICTTSLGMLAVPTGLSASLTQ